MKKWNRKNVQLHLSLSSSELRSNNFFIQSLGELKHTRFYFGFTLAYKAKIRYAATVVTLKINSCTTNDGIYFSVHFYLQQIIIFSLVHFTLKISFATQGYNWVTAI